MKQLLERMKEWLQRLGASDVAMAAVAAMALLALLVGFLAPKARAQQFSGYRRVTFSNPALPTPYAPFLVFTNNGTNSGYAPAITQTMTNLPGNANPLTVWNTTNMTPAYIGNDWLPSVPVTIVEGFYAPNPPSGVTNCAATNYLSFSPDGNYWTPSNTLALGAQFTSGTTNWFYFYLPNGGGQTNMAWASWDGCYSTNALFVVYFGFQVPK